MEHVDLVVGRGLVVNPTSARSQIEGGVIPEGVSSTLKEAISNAIHDAIGAACASSRYTHRVQAALQAAAG